MPLSSRHHYIPKFLIKGFCNSNGTLYVYDKHKDQILNSSRSSKSVFFESNRNTVSFDNGDRSSLIEDEMYQMFDNVLSKVIKELQEKEICEELISDGNMSLLLSFIITQFWRLPKNDSLVKQIIREAYIGPLSQEINDTIADDVNESKILRMQFFEYTLRHIESIIEKPKDYFVQLHEFEEDTFIIGDYPFVFKYQPEVFTDLALTDYVFALSSKRILLYSLNPLEEFSFPMSHNYNVCMIENSDRYIASGNKEKLKESIDAYKYVKDAKLENQIRFELFKAY